MELFSRKTVTQAANFILCCLVSLSLQGQESAPSTDPKLIPFEAVYYAYKWDENLGSAKISLQQLSPGLFSLTYQSKVSKFFLTDKRFEHSIFTVKDNQISAKEYNYSRTGTGLDKNLKVTFDQQPSPSITIVRDDELTTQPWQGEFDNQLYRLDIPLRLAKNDTDIHYDFINYRGQQRQYHISVIGKEMVSLPYGKLKAIKVEILRQSKSRKTYAWFAPDLAYQLVRLQQFKDGDEQGDLRLKAFSLKVEN